MFWKFRLHSTFEYILGSLEEEIFLSEYFSFLESWLVAKGKHWEPVLRHALCLVCSIIGNMMMQDDIGCATSAKVPKYSSG